MGNCGEIPELLYQVLHFDAHFILGRTGRDLVQRSQGDPGLFQIRRLVEKDHEPVFQPGFHRPGGQAPPLQGGNGFPGPGGNVPDGTAFRHRIDDLFRVIQQGSLEHPVGQFFRWVHFEAFSRRHLAQFLGSPFKQHLAQVQHIHMVAHGRLVHVGGAYNDAEVFFPDHLLNDDPQLVTAERVHPYGRFVQDQQIRRTYQGAGQSQFLLHAPGQLPGQPSGKGSQPGHIQQFSKTVLPGILGNPVQVRIQIQVLLNGQVFIKAEFLGYVADPGLDFLRPGH